MDVVQAWVLECLTNKSDSCSNQLELNPRSEQLPSWERAGDADYSRREEIMPQNSAG